MKITSCDCYEKIYEKLDNNECIARAEKKPYNVIEDCFDVIIVSKGRGRIKQYEDVRCCQFCGKKIEVEDD